MLSELKSKKIGIIGFGREGRSLADFLLDKNISDITVLDQSEEVDAEDYESRGVQFILGEDYLDELTDFDLLLRSPGVPYRMEELQTAKEQGVELSSATKLFFSLNQETVVGVTGSKGKGTTVTLIANMLRSGLGQERVHLAGNIGVPMLDILSDIDEGDIIVLELSSFQLEDLETSPEIAVLLNVVPEHLSHHGGFRNYVAAKANILRYQKPDDLLITNLDHSLLIRLSRKSPAEKIWISRDRVPNAGPAFVADGDRIEYIDSEGQREFFMSQDKIGLLGSHNLENVLPSIAVGDYFDIDRDIIEEEVNTFRGLPHRLQFVDKIDGVEFYDDSIATIPQATIAAIQSFDQPMAVILGGRAKEVKFNEVAKVISENSVFPVLIGESASEIAQSLESYDSSIDYRFADDLEDAVRKSYDLLGDSGIVLLSPACTSFDEYGNFAERGDHFQEIVNQLQ